MPRPRTTPWDAADYLHTEADMVAYLTAALEDGDAAVVAADGYVRISAELTM